MGLDFGKQKPEQQFREEMRILATQIETINQQLAGGSGGSGGPALQKQFADVNAKLTFIYEFLKTFQTDMRADNRASFEEVQKSVTATLQKNLGDIYAAHQETNKTLKTLQVGSAGGTPQDLEDIKATLKQLISVYREEVQVFKDQNAFLQKKLVDIEGRLSQLEK